MVVVEATGEAESNGAAVAADHNKGSSGWHGGCRGRGSSRWMNQQRQQKQRQQQQQQQ